MTVTFRHIRLRWRRLAVQTAPGDDELTGHAPPPTELHFDRPVRLGTTINATLRVQAYPHLPIPIIDCACIHTQTRWSAVRRECGRTPADAGQCFPHHAMLSRRPDLQLGSGSGWSFNHDCPGDIRVGLGAVCVATRPIEPDFKDMAHGSQLETVVERNHRRGMVDLLPLNDFANINRDNRRSKAAVPGSDD